MMKILFTMEAEIENKSVKIQVKEDLDIFTIAQSIAIEYGLGSESEQEIMIVILETLASMMDSPDVELKRGICRLLNNTVSKQAGGLPISNNTKSIKEQNIATNKRRHQPVTLYDRALRSKEVKKRVAKQIKSIKAEQEVKECTFQPQINDYPSLQRSNTHQILYRNAKMVKDKQEWIRKNRQQQAVEGYSFKPEINQNSLKLIKNKSFNAFKRTPYQQEYSHQPSISKGSQKIASQFPDFKKRLERYMNGRKQAICQRERQKQNSHLHLSKLEKIEKDKYKQIFDDEGRDQERRLKLYGLLQIPCKHEQQSTISTNSTFSMNSRSEELFLKKKARAFDLIFQSVECDGIVNEETIQCHNLSHDLFTILEPLLSQISQLQVSLNKLQFLNSLERLFSSLGTIQKQLLINHETKKKWEEGHSEYRNKYSFHPTISQKSKDLAFKKEMKPFKHLKLVRTFENEEEETSLIERYLRDNFKKEEQDLDMEEDQSKEPSEQENEGQSRFTIEEQSQEQQSNQDENQSDIELI